MQYFKNVSGSNTAFRVSLKLKIINAILSFQHFMIIKKKQLNENAIANVQLNRTNERIALFALLYSFLYCLIVSFIALHFSENLNKQ